MIIYFEIGKKQNSVASSSNINKYCYKEIIIIMNIIIV